MLRQRFEEYCSELGMQLCLKLEVTLSLIYTLSIVLNTKECLMSNFLIFLFFRSESP